MAAWGIARPESPYRVVELGSGEGVEMMRSAMVVLCKQRRCSGVSYTPLPPLSAMRYSGSIFSIPWYCDDAEQTSHSRLPKLISHPYEKINSNEKYRQHKNYQLTKRNHELPTTTIKNSSRFGTVSYEVLWQLCYRS